MRISSLNSQPACKESLLDDQRGSVEGAEVKGQSLSDIHGGFWSEQVRQADSVSWAPHSGSCRGKRGLSFWAVGQAAGRGSPVIGGFQTLIPQNSKFRSSKSQWVSRRLAARLLTDLVAVQWAQLVWMKATCYDLGGCSSAHGCCAGVMPCGS